jgi:hypothetical protein
MKGAQVNNDNFVILTPAEVCEIIFPADPDNIAHVGQGLYRARWIGAAVSADDIRAIESNVRTLITSQRPLSAETDGVSGYEMLIKVRAARNWIPVWLTIGRENPWVVEAEDPPFNERSFHECKTVDELIEKFDHGNWCLGQAFYLGDTCFINQVDGGDEWLVIKQDCAFESFTARLMVHDSLYPFKRLIEDIQNATLDQCRKLEYTNRFEEREKALRTVKADNEGSK